MPRLLRALSFVLCLPCLAIAALPALAATWQEERDAGLEAFSSADYARSAERLERALAAAREAQASPEELGAILERLATAQFAVRQFRRAQDSIAQWDEILNASAGEDWVAEQRVDRDVLAVLVSEVQGEPEPEPASPNPDAAPAAAPAAQAPAASGEAYTPDPEADTPFAPDEAMDVPADSGEAHVPDTAADTPFAPDAPTDMLAPDSAAIAEDAAAPPPAPGRAAIHLLSLTELAAAEASWDALRASYPDLLAGKGLEVRPVEIEDQGLYYRLYAVPFADAAAAANACAAFEAVQHYCAVATLE